MRRILLVLALAAGAQARGASDETELTALLNDFLAGASRGDRTMHDRFWSEDLIYTSSAGRRIGKADILRDLSAPRTTTAEPQAKYFAEDIRIRLYGDAAVVAFRLVGTTPEQVTRYWNTGTFVKRSGQWRAVAWQATRIPASDGEPVKERR
jgi:hypothetical protein